MEEAVAVLAQALARELTAQKELLDQQVEQSFLEYHDHFIFS